MIKQRKMLLATSIAGIFSTFLPWVTFSAGAFGFSASRNFNGLHYTVGIFYFILMLVIAALALAGNRQEMLRKNFRLGILAAGTLSFLCAIAYYSVATDEAGAGLGYVSVNAGPGFIIALAASAAIIAIPLFLKRPGENLGSDLSGLTAETKNLFEKNKPQMQTREAFATTELEKLLSWKEQGIISAEEFETLKSKLFK